MSTKNVIKREKVKHRKNKTGKILKGITCNMFKCAYFLLRSYLDMLIDFIFSIFWESERQPIPALEAKHSMLAESAVELAERIRNKELKSELVVRSCIERIKAVNPILNAVTDERFEDALQDARDVDKMIESGLPDDFFKQKPFLGVPFTAKESHAVAGLVNSLGIISRKHTRAPVDAECVRLLRQAGAIPVAVTNVPEINKWQETRNMLFGQTNNPYHTGRTTGGSSGGEAALSAALASPITLCSDIGGSTRMPAFFCGLYALNPTAGYTSLKGSALGSGEEPTMASIGFVSKHCSDLAPLTKVVLDKKAKEFDLDRPVDIKNVRIFYTESSHDLRVSPVSRELRKAMTDTITHLTTIATSTDKAPKAYYHKGFNHMFAIWKHGMSKESDYFPAMLANNHGEAKAFVELGKKLLGQSQFTLAAILKLFDDQVLPKINPEWGEKITQDLKDDLLKVLGTDGVLMFPSAPAAAPYHYSLLLRPFNFSYWGVFNALHFPAAQVPLGLNSSGVPLGIQVVAAPKQEALCLAVADYLGKTVGGYKPPCKIYT